jgi:DNA repair protein RecO (recombination protein O)
MELGEADCIVTFYTPYKGKLRAVAKGARRPKSKLGGHIEPFSYNKILIAQGKNLDIISQIQTIDSFYSLRNDLWLTSCALYVLELVDRFTAEEEENHRLFHLLLDTLYQLCQTDSVELVLRYFEMHFLDYLGYRPQIQRCVDCDAPLKPAVNYFTSSGGGILCSGCRNQELVVSPISVDALKVMRFLQDNDYSRVKRLHLKPELSGELEQLLRRYIRYLLEREVGSAEWLDRLRREINLRRQV